MQAPEAAAEPSGPPPAVDDAPAATAAAVGPKTTNTPELDLPKLQSLPAEQQELFLLTFVAALRKHVLGLSPDDCTAQQFYLKKEIFQVLNLATPPPSRVVRNNLGRCASNSETRASSRADGSPEDAESIAALLGVVARSLARKSLREDRTLFDGRQPALCPEDQRG